MCVCVGLGAGVVLGDAIHPGEVSFKMKRIIKSN